MKSTISTILLCAVALSGCGGPAPVVTQAEYLNLQNGMTIEQVKSIVGEGGTQNQKMDSMGFQSETWIWQNSNGSNLICMFQNGKLAIKTATQLP